MTKFLILLYWIAILFYITQYTKTANAATVWTKQEGIYELYISGGSTKRYLKIVLPQSLQCKPCPKCANNKWGGTEILPKLPNSKCLVTYDAAVINEEGIIGCAF